MKQVKLKIPFKDVDNFATFLYNIEARTLLTYLKDEFFEGSYLFAIVAIKDDKLKEFSESQYFKNVVA